jgi:hypothetical protein
MTDRELLELAAKAAGELTPSWYGNDAYFDGVLSRWNPLTDDGDALRLAVKIKWVPSRVEVVGLSMNEDPYAATRRAIVRAAAEIGRGMK